MELCGGGVIHQGAEQVQGQVWRLDLACCFEQGNWYGQYTELLLANKLWKK